MLESLFFIALPKVEAEAVRLTRSSEVLRCEDGMVVRLFTEGALKKKYLNLVVK